MAGKRSVLVAAVCWLACTPEGRTTTPAGDGGGAPDQASPFAPPAGDGCPPSAKLVYVIDQSGELSSFKPDTQGFHSVGFLKCPAQVAAKPFSMSIDRSASAWVL